MGEQVRDEFEKLGRQSWEEQPCSVAKHSLNALSNRYFNVLPFDFNRVVLEVCPAAQPFCQSVIDVPDD